jgi:methionine sulfoxide reductase catalytic subunit
MHPSMSSLFRPVTSRSASGLWDVIGPGASDFPGTAITRHLRERHRQNCLRQTYELPKRRLLLRSPGTDSPVSSPLPKNNSVGPAGKADIKTLSSCAKAGCKHHHAEPRHGVHSQTHPAEPAQPQAPLHSARPITAAQGGRIPLQHQESFAGPGKLAEPGNSRLASRDIVVDRMLIQKPADFKYSEITPKPVYLNRRRFLAGLPAAYLAGRELLSPSAHSMAATNLPNLAKSPLSTTEPPNPIKDVSTYNNYYEFGTGKDQPATLAQKLNTNPWTVSVEGDVAKPRKFSIDEITKLAPLEERIYRLRCVERWSVVVPWVGYSLSALLKQVEPTSKAKFVAFETYYNSKIMLSSMAANIPFPYVEGLRLDEAMHPLALLCVGMYGETLPPQNGAPVRIVVPWKYGFKSIKSIVKIKLTGSMPPTTWNIANAQEYGFYSNVNPKVDHPRWSQAAERRLGEFRMRPTQMFNGYGDQVASLYTGMDLKKYY